MGDNPQIPRPPPKNRRKDKFQFSCEPCKQRKLRCDQKHPCGGCLRRGLAKSCNHATTSSMSDAQRQTATLNGRLFELESLVMTLMKGQGPSLPAPKSPRTSSLSFADVAPAVQISKQPQNQNVSPADPGTLKLDDGGTYVQSSHWEAILIKIRGLKEDLAPDNLEAPLGSYLFYGPNRHATPDEILAAVPSRPIVDRLMALHFDSYMITPFIIHSKKFLREYETFWEDPSSASIAWVGLMFSMLYIAAQLQTFTIEFTDGRAESLKAEYLHMKDVFREKTVQCLILARYTTGGSYILETLIMVLTGEVVLSKNSATDGSLSISMILHLAIRMGYHRDPGNFPGISPFDCEMRRRIWATILQLDLALSLETGLPRSATDTHIDTKQPRNLRDCDFDEETTEMPPPRPETEWTPVLPLIAKDRLIAALGLICDINSDIKIPSYDQVKKVDALLEDVHNRAIPPVLRWGTTPHSITDSPNLVMQRVSVETSYHKSRILLHRRALVSSSAQKLQHQDRESVRICLDSALKILSFQQMLHEESQPFGRLYQLRWKVTHIFNQDVLLATSILCLYLQDSYKFEYFETPEQRMRPLGAEEIRQRLTTSHNIWLQMSTTSAEAGKVAKALSIVLGITGEPSEGSTGSASYDFVTDFDARTLEGFDGAMLNNQYLSAGFYSPLNFFDNVLENWGT